MVLHGEGFYEDNPKYNICYAYFASPFVGAEFYRAGLSHPFR